MRAVQLEGFGGSGSLKLVDMSRPEPKADEILIEETAARPPLR
jgi:NADPH:quinone reductase-like Zn-dependent oxidoreductase